RMDRRTAQVMCFAEGSLTGMACEAIVRGFDPAGVMADMVFSSPGTDVIDVGSDIGNSEVMNSFLNTADITKTGIVTEEALRHVYDAYSYTCARMLTERWHEPTSRMSAQLRARQSPTSVKQTLTKSLTKAFTPRGSAGH
ncbi:hypothetical protein JX266_014486, partial [Neoarthrinium moseri]